MIVDLAIVIVTYNSAHVIEDLLDSLPAAVGSLTSDVVVVDNGSSDSTTDVVAQRDDCTLIESTNRGYAAGINTGVAAAQSARATLVLNPDVRLLPQAAAIMLSVADGGCGIVAPQVRGDDGRLHLSLRREPTILRELGLTRSRIPALSEYVSRSSDYLAPASVDWALGAVLLVTRECADAIGEWDESFFLYSEETDLCARARDAGFEVRYEPTAVAVHIGAQSGADERTYSMQIVNRVRYYSRRHSRLASWTYYALATFNEVRRIPGGHQHGYTVKTLLRPRLRPTELDCGDSLLPS